MPFVKYVMLAFFPSCIVFSYVTASKYDLIVNILGTSGRPGFHHF